MILFRSNECQPRDVIKNLDIGRRKLRRNPLQRGDPEAPTAQGLAARFSPDTPVFKRQDPTLACVKGKVRESVPRIQRRSVENPNKRVRSSDARIRDNQT